jgi:hypothetical protein
MQPVLAAGDGATIAAKQSLQVTDEAFEKAAHFQAQQAAVSTRRGLARTRDDRNGPGETR